MVFMDIGERVLDCILDEYGDHCSGLAFMPYKRQMWSCMETVYKAAKRRGIDCAVIPVPYKFKRYGAWRTDDFLEYDIDTLESFNPDICVIHYPYDGGNKLTEIHPDYYAWTLRQQGKKIVYIPYFGFGCGDAIANQPGTLLADMIILDREEYKAPYLKAGIPEEVLYVTGCPKRDLLDEKPEVVLMALSLTPFLNHLRPEIDKIMKRVLDELAKGNLVVYRPHPLLTGGVEHFRPEMVDEYSRFMYWMRERCMVYEGGNMEQAMLIADRMICDGGSIVTEWECLADDKPIEII